MGALVVLIVMFAVLNPGAFLTILNVRTILDQAAIPLIVGVGATLVILMGSIDLSVEGVMGAAGMTFVLTVGQQPRHRGSRGRGDSSLAVALGAFLGLCAGLIHTRLKVPSFIVTLGMWFVGLGMATVLFGTDTDPVPARRRPQGVAEHR